MLWITGKHVVFSQSFSLASGEEASIAEPSAFGDVGLSISAQPAPIYNADPETGIRFEERAPNAMHVTVPFAPGTSVSYELDNFSTTPQGRLNVRVTGICMDKFILVHVDVYHIYMTTSAQP